MKERSSRPRARWWIYMDAACGHGSFKSKHIMTTDADIWGLRRMVTTNGATWASAARHVGVAPLPVKNRQETGKRRRRSFCTLVGCAPRGARTDTALIAGLDPAIHPSS